MPYKDKAKHVEAGKRWRERAREKAKIFGLTKTYILSKLTYDAETGKLFRKGGRFDGKLAGSINTSGHRQILLDGAYHHAHRLVWIIETGSPPSRQIDHINGNPSDNRFTNLREATCSENQMNVKLRRDNTSGKRGVSFNSKRNRWHACIQVRGSKISIGAYVSLEDAIRARKEAELKWFGSFNSST